MKTQKPEPQPDVSDWSREDLTHEYLRAWSEIQRLKEKLGLANRRMFGASSEAAPTAQFALVFDEAELEASPEAPEPELETITYTRARAPRQRTLDLGTLPVEEIEYTLPEGDRACPQCSGEMHSIGHDVRQELKRIPASITLVKHCREKFACRHCQQNERSTPIRIAPAPVPAFPGSLASPSIVASIMDRKFVEGMPLYRQQQSLARLGVDISRQTMANWMIAGSRWLQIVYDAMRERLVERDVLHADETTVQVLREAERAAQTQSYMWLYRTGRDGPHIVLFDYQTTRSGEHPRRFLERFTGYLHADGYSGYHDLPGATLCGCWEHVRRKFVDAVNVQPKDARKAGQSASHKGLEFCNRLFGIERGLHDVTPDGRRAGRQLHSRKALDQMREWLDQTARQASPKSLLGSALTYCVNQWPKLCRFLEDGRLEIDNNRAERSIKPFVIGRKNWLFANTPKGATASAVTYSIVETAKENGLNPAAYLQHLFEQLPNIDIHDPRQLDQLLPWSEVVKERCAAPANKRA
jgi:transposase